MKADIKNPDKAVYTPPVAEEFHFSMEMNFMSPPTPKVSDPEGYDGVDDDEFVW